MSGIEMMTDAALIVPSGFSNSVEPVKNAIAAGTVRAFGDEVSVTARRNSFQAKMKVRIAVVAMPGAASGITIFVNAWKLDRKSTRLNSSHTVISYAVFCLKKKKKKQTYSEYWTKQYHRTQVRSQ